MQTPQHFTYGLGMENTKSIAIAVIMTTSTHRHKHFSQLTV